MRESSAVQSSRRGCSQVSGSHWSAAGASTKVGRVPRPVFSKARVRSGIIGQIAFRHNRSNRFLRNDTYVRVLVALIKSIKLMILMKLTREDHFDPFSLNLRQTEHMLHCYNERKPTSPGPQSKLKSPYGMASSPSLGRANSRIAWRMEPDRTAARAPPE